MPKTVMIVAGESSGELYGALLASELKRMWPGVRVIGVGGQRMKDAGVEVFSGVAGAFGLTEAVAHYRALKETFNKAVDLLKEARPDVLVPIDYPEFNIRLAREAGRLGIKVLYYVSPQVWAWRRSRVKTLAEVAQRMAVVLPFEPDLYKSSGLPCEFVGHPVMDDIKTYFNLTPAREADSYTPLWQRGVRGDFIDKIPLHPPFPKGDKRAVDRDTERGISFEGPDIPPHRKDEAKAALGIEGRPLVALLPGSRGSELKRLLPVMLETAREFKKAYPGYGLVMPLAPNIDKAAYRDIFNSFEAEGVSVTEKSAVLALAASEAAVIASGTATLQATFLETPTVVIYKVFPLTYLVAKIVLDVEYITITNIILGREALPELIQGRANPALIVRELGPILDDPERRGRMLEDIRKVKGMFADKAPSRRVAEMAGEMAGWA